MAANKRELGLYNESEKISLDAITCATEVGYKRGICSAYSGISYVYLNRDKNYNRAKEYALKSYEMAKEIGYLSVIKESAKSLHAIYHQMNDFKNAYHYQTIYYTIKDSIQNDEIQKVAIKQNFKLEYESKEIKIKAANEFEKKAIILKAEEEKKVQTIIIYTISIGLVMMIALAGFIFKNLQVNKRMNKIISEQKHLVEEKQKEILDSIHYAKRIQTALLTSEKYIDRSLNKLSKFSKD